MSQLSKKVRRRVRTAYQLDPLCPHCVEERRIAIMEQMAADQAERDRPGHIFRIDEDGSIVYMEDVIAEQMLGRKLKTTEQVVHRNGNPQDNRRDNLEIVSITKVQ